MFHRVIWATDGSELAQRALPLAVDLATHDDGELVALHVDELIVGYGGAYPVRMDEPELRRELEKQVTALRASGVNARLVIESAGVVGTAQAIATSVAVSFANWRVLFGWGALIVLFTGAGLVTGCLGLIVTMPLIGHASWHAYRDLVGEAP